VIRARALAVAITFGALVVLALPAGALAKPGYFKLRGESSEQIVLNATNGFKLHVEVYDRRATLSFGKETEKGGNEFFTYSFRRRLAPGPNLHLNLGKEGVVDLRFVPGHREENRMAGCKGGPSVIETGHLVGTIRIHGRDGFTDVDAHRVYGVVARTPAQTCRRQQPKRGIDVVGVKATKGKATVPKGALELFGAAPGGPLFSALRVEERELSGDDFEDFDAAITHRTRAWTTTSVASAEGGVGGDGGFLTPDPGEPLSAATIAPAAPFSGSATFAMTSAHGYEWSGDLTAELPGYGRVPLTGPKVAVGLCETTACTPTLPKWLRPKTSS